MAPKPTDPFAEMRKIQRSLNARLGKAPLVTISGVVAADGPGGSKSQGERQWTFSVDFDGWRVAGGALRTEKLLVRRKVTEKELNRYQNSIKPYDVLRIRARLLDQPRPSAGIVRGAAADALLVKILGPDRKDQELRRHAAALQKPVTRRDPVLGKLTYDRRLNGYDARAKWNGKPVKVSLSPDGDGEDGRLDTALRTAHALWRDQGKWSRQIADFAVKRLLKLKNEAWRDEDEPPVSAAEFARRMKLESITVNPDGSFAFWHDDGDLFWGHTIVVSGTAKRGPTDADIAG